MVTKDDCLTILVQLEDRGVNIDKAMKQLVLSRDVPIEVLKFITDNRGIEVGNFYEMLRKNYNAKKSPLYVNILKGEEANQDFITTLACLLTQIVLYSNKLTDTREQFLKEVRAEEITRALNEYFKNAEVETCYKLLKLLRADLTVLEYIAGRRIL